MIFVNGSGGSDANDGSSWVQALATVTAGFTVTGGNADGSGGGRTDRGGGVFAAETSPTVRACVLSADPLFYNTDTHNYRLASGSPCIDVGTTTAQTLLDLDGAIASMKRKRSPWPPMTPGSLPVPSSNAASSSW